jgi:heptosyltransferase-2
MVTTDTGLMHAADALQKQMVVLWGGSVLEKNKPLTKSARIIHLGSPCQPCLKTGSYKTCENSRCMNDISVGEVMFNIREVLKCQQ